MDVAQDLIYDLGMHRALDTDFYLRKGFRVVALEANPDLCKAARDRHADAIADGRLQIIERALWENDGESLTFYVNPVKDDWSSVKKGWSEKGGHTAIPVEVRSITLPAMFDAWGVPRYIKCDIEGADLLFTEQLLKDTRRPDFVSVEAMDGKLLANLSEAGYSRFQLVNQAFLPSIKPPQPPREGNYAEVKFNGHMSGLFGDELDPSKWESAEEILLRHQMFRALKAKDQMLAHGWLDFHAGR